MPMYDVLAEVEILDSVRSVGEVIEIDEDSAAEFLENGSLAVHAEPGAEETVTPVPDVTPAEETQTEPEPTPEASPVEPGDAALPEPAPEVTPSEAAPEGAKPWVGGHTV